MTVNPYQTPTGTDAKTLPTVFRTTFWPVYLVAVPSTWLVATGASLIVGPPLTPGSALSIVLSCVVCLLLTAFLTLFFRIYVSAEGIRCFDFWGRYHTTPWEAIERCHVINLLGLRYLRLIAPGHATVWLPLFLHQSDAFWELIGRWAPPALSKRDQWN